MNALILTAAALLAAPPAPLSVANLFADHMVIQRDRPIRVWGVAEPGREVAVAFGGRKAVAKAGARGDWLAVLPSFAANSVGGDLAVSDGTSSLAFKDVLVGDVWLAGGQSNMAMTAHDAGRQLEPIRRLLLEANTPSIRMLGIVEGESPTPLDDLRGRAKWVVCSPETAPGFSAVAYFFARRLHRELGVPIGVIDTSRGGTPIEPFIPREAFRGHPTLEKELELGDKGDLQGLKMLPGGVFARDANWLPGRLFHSRIAPLKHLSLRGAIWYQGESNCGVGEDPRDYEHKMRALVEGWRTAFADPRLPVYFVQLPGSGASGRWPYLRERQRLASRSIPNVGMVVTIDLEGGDIHPPNKFDVGERLAAWPLARDFGRQIPFSGPMFSEARIEAGRLVVSFQHAENGLMVASKSGVEPTVATPEVPLRHFELRDDQGNWRTAKAEIDGATVVVTVPNGVTPVAVRYAFGIDPRGCNLYGKGGLPASPFCSKPELLPIDAN